MHGFSEQSKAEYGIPQVTDGQWNRHTLIKVILLARVAPSGFLLASAAGGFAGEVFEFVHDGSTSWFGLVSWIEGLSSRKMFEVSVRQEGRSKDGRSV